MDTLKVGLIATGGRGRNGWQAHQPDKGATIVAGTDTNPAAQAEFKEKFPEAKLYSDYKELLKDPEIGAVFISTPDYLHEEMAVDALKAGKAIYLEKPMAITIEGCDRILHTAMETGSKLFIGHNMRHFPVILKMREVIQSGIIGEIKVGWTRHFVGYGGDAYFRDWHSEQRYSNGLLLQKGAHDIDVMHWLMGTYTKSVVGMGMLSVYEFFGRGIIDQSFPYISVKCGIFKAEIVLIALVSKPVGGCLLHQFDGQSEFLANGLDFLHRQPTQRGEVAGGIAVTGAIAHPVLRKVAGVGHTAIHRL